MKIFIYSPQREISQIISDHLSFKGNHCIPFETTEDLSSMVRNMHKGPDLLILDYLSYNHEIFSINKYLKSINRYIPVVFFNDPCLTRSTRAAHWKAVLQTTQTGIHYNDFSIFDETLKTLEELIVSEEFSPYIPLLQPPKKIPESLIKNPCTLEYMKDNSDDCITTFKERNHLPAKLFYLLTILQQNKDNPLSINQIIELYKLDGKSVSAQSLKVYFSELKKIVWKDKECRFLIHHENKTYRFVRFR